MNEVMLKFKTLFADNPEKDVLLTLLLLEEEKNFKNISTKKYPIDKPIERATKKSVRTFMRHCLMPVDMHKFCAGSSIKGMMELLDQEQADHLAGFVKGITQVFPTFKGVESHEKTCFEFFNKLYTALIPGLFPSDSHVVNGQLLINMSMLDPDLSSEESFAPAYNKKRGDIVIVRSKPFHVTAIVDNIDESVVTELQLHPQFMLDYLKIRTTGDANLNNSYVITHLKQVDPADDYLSEAAKQLVNKIDTL